MSRTLPINKCDICGKLTFCHNLGDHLECKECYGDGKLVEGHCLSSQKNYMRLSVKEKLKKW